MTVLGAKVVSETVGFSDELEASGVKVVSESVWLSDVPEASGVKVVSETVWLTTELVTKVGLKLTSVVDEGGLVCVTIMVVSCGVVSEIVAI